MLSQFSFELSVGDKNIPCAVEARGEKIHLIFRRGSALMLS